MFVCVDVMKEMIRSNTYRFKTNLIKLKSLDDNYRTKNDFGRGIIIDKFPERDERRQKTILRIHQGIYQDLIDAFAHNFDVKIKGNSGEALAVSNAQGQIRWAKDVAEQDYADIEIKFVYLCQKTPDYFPTTYQFDNNIKTLVAVKGPKSMKFEEISPSNGLIGTLQAKIVISDAEEIVLENFEFTSLVEDIFISKNEVVEESFFDSVMAFFSSKEDKKGPVRSVPLAELHVRAF